jgi:hypothetical protein
VSAWRSRQLPFVRSVGQRVGRAEKAEDTNGTPTTATCALPCAATIAAQGQADCRHRGDRQRLRHRHEPRPQWTWRRLISARRCASSASLTCVSSSSGRRPDRSSRFEHRAKTFIASRERRRGFEQTKGRRHPHQAAAGGFNNTSGRSGGAAQRRTRNPSYLTWIPGSRAAHAPRNDGAWLFWCPDVLRHLRYGPVVGSGTCRLLSI